MILIVFIHHIGQPVYDQFETIQASKKKRNNRLNVLCACNKENKKEKKIHTIKFVRKCFFP